jgi:hypothetical protein
MKKVIAMLASIAAAMVLTPFAAKAQFNDRAVTPAATGCEEAAKEYNTGHGEKVAGIVLDCVGIPAAALGTMMIIGGEEIVHAPISDTLNVAASIITAIFGNGLVGAMAISGGIVIASTGLILAATGTTLIFTGNAHLKKSAALYEECNGYAANSIDYRIKIGPTPSGIGLTFSFMPSASTRSAYRN